jgi:Glycosyltransferase family 92
MDGDAGARQTYLSICACLGFDAPYLREWIEFHRLVGVERFFLYNNGDRHAQRELLASYVEQGTVVLHDWPEFPPVFSAYEHCLRTHGRESRWIAFIDTDEFLFSPLDQPLPAVLADYEQWPAVGVNWAMFGTSGHRSRPAGLVIDSYRRRTTDPAINRHVKSIVDPARTDPYCDNPHYFFYKNGAAAVDENRNPLEGPLSDTVSVTRLRINHYWTRSEEEATAKFARNRADDGSIREPPDFAALDQNLNAEPDDTITAYVPALRSVLAGGDADNLLPWQAGGSRAA